jgi:hypothetical protein
MSILSQEVRNILARLPAGVDDDVLRYGITHEVLPVECITLHPVPEQITDDEDFFFEVSTAGILVEFLDCTPAEYLASLLPLEVCHGR